MMDNWQELTTEQNNVKSENIDEVSTLEMLHIINREDKKVADAVAAELTSIADAVDLVTYSLKNNGRLFYVGAGSSGRLGILDAVECPPTYGISSDVIQGIIAGGNPAVFHSIEGAEDDFNGAINQFEERKICSTDIVLGIAASGVTPYVKGALEYALNVGCKTIFLTCNQLNAIPNVDIIICPVVGPEVITGSTRLKAGSATKLVLNMISTATMVSLGKTYGNYMVDLKPTNNKLRNRSLRIFRSITRVTEAEAQTYLESADNNLKTALVMKLRNCKKSEAIHLLSKSNQSVKQAIRSL